MCRIRKARIAYGGTALENGTMPVRDLAPALLAFSDLVEHAYQAIGGEKQIKVLLNQDSLNKGSFDITFLLNADFLEQVKMFVTSAQDTGLDALMTVLGWGTTAYTVGEGIFWLIQKIHGRRIAEIHRKENQKAEIVLEDGDTIRTSENTIRVFLSVDCRVSVEKIIDPLHQPGIDSFELRNPEEPDSKAPLVKVDKAEAELFKAPPPDTPQDIEQKTVEQEMLARIISVNFELGKWRFSDGTNTFWASITDQEFLSKVEKSEIAFRKGDTMKIRYYLHQTIKGGKLTTEYIITKVLEMHEAPRQIKLDF